VRLALQVAIGDDVALCASSDLESSERLLNRLKKNRITLALVTPHSIHDSLLWWMLGVAEGAGKPAFALRTAGVSFEAARHPLRAEQVVHLARREEIVRLLRSVQTDLRRREKDLSELDLEALLRKAAHEGSSSDGERGFVSDVHGQRSLVSQRLDGVEP